MSLLKLLLVRRLIRLSGVNFCPKSKSSEIVCRPIPDVWKWKTNVSGDSKKSLSAYLSGKSNYFKKVVTIVEFSSPNEHFQTIFSFRRLIRLPGVIFDPKLNREKSFVDHSLTFGNDKLTLGVCQRKI